MPPSELAHVSSLGTLSTLTPRTWAAAPAKRDFSVSYSGICALQVGVHAAGWNARTTFLPRRALSLTVPPRWLLSSKSGASSPTLRVGVSLASEVVPLGTAIAALLARSLVHQAALGGRLLMLPMRPRPRRTGRESPSV